MQIVNLYTHTLHTYIHTHTNTKQPLADWCCCMLQSS